MAHLPATCPQCGAALQLYIDDSSGPPSEVGAECACGAIPVFQITWEPTYYLGPFVYDERVYPYGPARAAASEAAA